MKSMRRPWYLFLILLSGISFLSAQQMNFRSMENILNLPSYECYGIMQDQKGHIWIATENGLCKFNGSILKCFGKESGLPEGSVYFMEEKKDGSLRIISSAGRILRIENDSVSDYPYTQKVKALLENTIEVAYSLSQAGKDKLILNAGSGSFEIDTRNMTVSAINPEAKNPEILFSIVAQTGRDYILKNIAHGPWKPKEDIKISYVAGNKRIIIPVPGKINANTPDWRIKVCEIGDVTFCSLGNKLIRIDKQANYTIYELPSIILSMYGDAKKGLWLGLFQHGVHYYKNIDRMTEFKVNLDGLTVSGTLVDREGGIWCSTLERGVFYCSNADIISYQNIAGLNRSCSLLKQVNGEVFISSSSDRLIILNGKEIRHKQFAINSSTEYTDLVSYKGKKYLGGYSSCSARQART